MRNPIAYACVVSALTTSVFAQTAGETIEVRVANVDVVVTDRGGRPIHGLTKDDFELYENRKPQAITNFYEIAGDTAAPAPAPAPAPAAEVRGVATAQAAEAPVEMRQRSLVIFVDNSSIDPLRRNQAIDETVAAVDRLMRRGDDAMLVTWDQRAHVVQPFTADPAALKRALESVRNVGGSLSNIAIQRNQVVSFASARASEVLAGRESATKAYADSVSEARAYAEWLRGTQVQMLNALTNTIATLSGIEGKKVLMFVGGELQERPGLDAFQQVDALFLNLVRNQTPAVIRETDVNMTVDLQKVARTANANGVTLYMVNVADRSRTAAEGSLQNLPNAEIGFTQEANNYVSMARLASDTGGTVISGSSNYTAILDTISRDLGSYYSLGYKPPAGGAADRTITVRVKRPGAIARTRRAYALKSAEELMHDRVIANAYHPAMKGDFPVAIETAPPEAFQSGLYRVKMTLTFPSDLTFVSDGQDMAGEYEVYVMTLAEDGTMSPLGKQTKSVRFPAATLATVRQQSLKHGVGLILKPGAQVVSVAVVDKLGARTGFARATVNPR